MNGTVTSWPALLAAASTAAQPPSTIRSASDTGRARAVELGLDAFERRQHPAQLARVVDLPVVLRSEADARTVGAAALVAVAERRGRRPGGRHQLGDAQTGVEDLGLERGDVGVADQLVVDGGNRVLPDQLLVGDLGAEVAGDRAHVAVAAA